MSEILVEVAVDVLSQLLPWGNVAGKKNRPHSSSCNPEKEMLNKTDFRYFNQHAGQEIAGAFVWGNYKDTATASDHIKRINYNIQTGAIFGLPRRFAMFFAALIAASLPLTGFYFWWEGKEKQGVLLKRLQHQIINQITEKKLQGLLI